MLKSSETQGGWLSGQLFISGALLTAGLVLVWFFHEDHLLSLKAGLLLLYLCAASGLVICHITAWSLLPRLMLIIYVLPFVSLSGFLWNDDFVWWKGGVAMELTSLPVLQVMVMVGLVGLVGLILGFSLSEWNRPREDLTPVIYGSISLPACMIVAALAVLLCGMNTRGETILTMAYASGEALSVAEGVNFNAASMMGYMLIMMLVVAYEMDLRRSLLKFLVILSAILFVVIFIQVAHGDRDCLGLVAGILAIYVTSAKGVKPVVRKWQVRKRVLLSVVMTVLILVLFIALGSLRFSLTEKSSVSLVNETWEGLSRTTWAAVLLTNLGSAYQFSNDQIEFLNGNTYLDYVKSLPPGFITRYFGIERPLESGNSPAWWFVGISSGGMHAAIVPFHNFGILGTFLILCLWGYLIGVVEKRGSRFFWPRFFYGGFYVFAFNWFWYGDMPFIRGLMCVVLVGWLHKLLTLTSGTIPGTLTPDRTLGGMNA